MKKILLVCSAGMSTSLLVTKMQEAAKEMQVEIDINALPVSECSTKINEVDIVLLGPQVRFQKTVVERLANGRIPVDIIDMRAYGMMDGKSILKSTLEKIK
ncbi:PTS sugar transporter subunit IIB [Sarcina ventriculi]|uniref:PTS sugar transporter subunit IIB n=1 Tax=Sarcina ventriculi TaxID=1267 RepID=UPI0018AC6951|nr:PTS sugar transporter subunit IIB [Sarcina ventriculi]